MTTVTFGDTQRFNLARELLRRAPSALINHTAVSSSTVTTHDVRLARLLTRLNGESWMILPYFGADKDYWLLTAQTPTQLEQARTRLVRFLTPSYGCFDQEQAIVNVFEPSASALQRLAAPLFPSGYYRWLSPVSNRNAILDRLMLWLDLEREEPKVQQEVVLTYAKLHQSFQEALAVQLWEDAERILAELERRCLTTAENLLFFRLQLLAAQEQWTSIWNDPRFPIWADLVVPRPIRSILLKAFYTQLLQSYEAQGEWEKGLRQFSQQRTRLGRLLSGPFQLDQPMIVRMVSYQAVADQDVSRIALLQAAALDPDSERILNSLLQISPSFSIATRSESLLDKATRVLAQQDYATAEHVIPMISEPDTRVVLFLELAFHTQDELIGQRAWGAYQSLSFVEQEALPNHNQFTAEYLLNLKDRLLPTSPLSDETHLNESTFPDMDMRQPQNLRSWQAIGDLERCLRKTIRLRYEAHFGDEWEQKLHTDAAFLARWRDMRSRDMRTFRQHEMPETSLLDYTYLEDLSGMIRRQWAIFQDLFDSVSLTREGLADKITAINRVRNPLAHNRHVPDSELIRAETYCTDMLRLFTCD